MEITKTVDITGCARCGGEHKQLAFRELYRPDPEFSYWAACPTNGEPILMEVKEAGDLTPFHPLELSPEATAQVWIELSKFFYSAPPAFSSEPSESEREQWQRMSDLFNKLTVRLTLMVTQGELARPVELAKWELSVGAKLGS